MNAKKLVLPGVGHFQAAMQCLQSTGLTEALNVAVLEKQVPVLGICLGMQLMARKSEEGSVDGLGWFDAEVVKMRAKNWAKYKIPHTGWNGLRHKRKAALTDGITEGSEFYFLHSYQWQTRCEGDVLSETEYESMFPSVVGKDNIFGVQFHPEKSHTVGEKLLRNFVEL